MEGAATCATYDTKGSARRLFSLVAVLGTQRTPAMAAVRRACSPRTARRWSSALAHQEAEVARCACYGHVRHRPSTWACSRR